MKLKLTRRSKLGWNYETMPTGQDAWSIELPEKPYYTGTYWTVCNAVAADNTYRSLRNGTYYTTMWFARHKGKWIAIVSDELWKLDWDDEVEVETKEENKQ